MAYDQLTGTHALRFLAATVPPPAADTFSFPVSYTHLTLPTNREV